MDKLPNWIKLTVRVEPKARKEMCRLEIEAAVQFGSVQMGMAWGVRYVSERYGSLVAIMAKPSLDDAILEMKRALDNLEKSKVLTWYGDTW